MNIHISRRVNIDPSNSQTTTTIKMLTNFLNVKDKAALELALEDTLKAIKECKDDHGRIAVSISGERFERKRDEIRSRKKTTPKLSPETDTHA